VNSMRMQRNTFPRNNCEIYLPEWGEPCGLQAGLRPYICKRRISPAKAPYFNNSGISVYKNEPKRSLARSPKRNLIEVPAQPHRRRTLELGMTIPARGRTLQFTGLAAWIVRLVNNRVDRTALSLFAMATDSPASAA
jgi:hypothetical protein